MRRLVFNCHLIAAFAASVVLVALSVTGILLLFEQQIDAWLTSDLAVPASGRPLPLAALVSKAAASAGNSPITELHLGAPARPAMAVTAGRTRIYLDPYTGRVLATRRGLLPSVWMRQLHKNLVAGTTGGWIVVSATVALLFQAVSGLYLWWPLKRIAIKLDASARRMVFDTHHAAGFFSSLFVVAICLTGLARHYPAITDRLFADTSVAAPVAGAGIGHAISIDDAAGLALAHFPGSRLVRINIPARPGKPFVVSARYPGDSSPFGLSEVMLDARSGRALAIEDFRTETPADRAQRIDRAIHTGAAGGYAGRALACLTALAVLVELVSGIWMWWKRSRSVATPASSIAPARSWP